MTNQEQATGGSAINEKAATRSHTDRFEEFLREEYGSGSYQAFVDNLEARGWLANLEQAGVIPGAEHTETRDQALQRLYIGSILGELDDQLLITPTLLFTRGSAEGLFDDED